MPACGIAMTTVQAQPSDSVDTECSSIGPGVHSEAEGGDIPVVPDADAHAHCEVVSAHTDSGHEECISIASSEHQEHRRWTAQTNERHELLVDGRVVVVMDGACRNNQHERSRLAGVGAFWAADHPFNVSEPLSGIEQTNNRAELTADGGAPSRGAF